jgi:hypothetical protein
MDSLDSEYRLGLRAGLINLAGYMLLVKTNKDGDVGDTGGSTGGGGWEILAESAHRAFNIVEYHAHHSQAISFLCSDALM